MSETLFIFCCVSLIFLYLMFSSFTNKIVTAIESNRPQDEECEEELDY